MAYGIPIFATKATTQGSGGPTVTVTLIHPRIRFVGLISPVNQMGPCPAWPTLCAGGTDYLAQVCDNWPGNPFIPEATIDHAGIATIIDDRTYITAQAAGQSYGHP